MRPKSRFIQLAVSAMKAGYLLLGGRDSHLFDRISARDPTRPTAFTATVAVVGLTTRSARLAKSAPTCLAADIFLCCRNSLGKPARRLAA